MNGTFGDASDKLFDDVNDADELRDIIRKNATTRVVDDYVLQVKGPKTALVFPPIIYGQGKGPVNQRSIQIPELSRVAIQTRQTIQVGKGESTWSNIHVADLSNVFVKLVEKALKGEEGDLWNQNGLYLVGNVGLLVSFPGELAIYRRLTQTVLRQDLAAHCRNYSQSWLDRLDLGQEHHRQRGGLVDA